MISDFTEIQKAGILFCSQMMLVAPDAEKRGAPSGTIKNAATLHSENTFLI